MKTTLNFPVLLILILFSNHAGSQKLNDTLRSNSMDALSVSEDSTFKTGTEATIIHPVLKSYSSVVNGLLSSNKFINVKEPAVFFIAQKKQMNGKEFVFYTLCIIVLILYSGLIFLLIY